MIYNQTNNMNKFYKNNNAQKKPDIKENIIWLVESKMALNHFCLLVFVPLFKILLLSQMGGSVG